MAILPGAVSYLELRLPTCRYCSCLLVGLICTLDLSIYASGLISILRFLRCRYCGSQVSKDIEHRSNLGKIFLCILDFQVPKISEVPIDCLIQQTY